MYKPVTTTKANPNKQPLKASIIITTYNRPVMIHRAVQSVLDQIYKGWELIIVDDGSTETYSLSQLASDKRVHYYKLDKNMGSAAARNIGFSHSTAPFVVFLDDDNEFHKDYLKETIYLLEKSPAECGGVRTGRTIKYADFEDYAPPITHTGFDSIDWGFLMKREVMDNIKYDLTLYADEDADFGIEFAKRYKQIPLNKALCIAHAESDEGSMCAPSERRLRGLDNFIKKHLEHFKKHPNELRYAYRLAGRNYYRAGHTLKGYSYFIKSFMAMKNWRTFKHLFFVSFGWGVYDRFMTREERRGAYQRISNVILPK